MSEESGDRGGVERRGLPAGVVEALSEVAGHPRDASAKAGIDTIQTHISWLFLSESRVYKLRKAVELPFLSFAARSERNADCLREVALNRRLAPDVYLGVAPVIHRPGGSASEWEIGPISEHLASSPEILEHCVVMRRLPDGCDAQTLVEADDLGRGDVERVADKLVAFHADAALPASALPDEAAWRGKILGPILDSLDLLAQHPCVGILQSDVERARRAAERRFEQLAPCFEERRRAGRIVDGHGDLQLAHVWFEGGPQDPLIIDCVEFRSDFRQVDVASEIAFFAMDLCYRGRPDLAEHFLARYARDADDYALYRVVDFFIAYRSAVRAGVASVAAASPQIVARQRAAAARSAERHLRLAELALAPPRSGRVAAICGIVGSGKTTVAEELCRTQPGPVLASDRVRKHLAGLRATDRGAEHPELALYDEAMSQRVYAGLLERAEHVLASGRAVVLDATFTLREHRDRLRDWAAGLGVDALLVEARCNPTETLRRLRQRATRGDDASDAGPDFYAASALRFEAPDEWPPDRHLVVATDSASWRDSLQRALRERDWHSDLPSWHFAEPLPQPPS